MMLKLTIAEKTHTNPIYTTPRYYILVAAEHIVSLEPARKSDVVDGVHRGCKFEGTLVVMSVRDEEGPLTYDVMESMDDIAAAI